MLSGFPWCFLREDQRGDARVGDGPLHLQLVPKGEGLCGDDGLPGFAHPVWHSLAHQ